MNILNLESFRPHKRKEARLSCDIIDFHLISKEYVPKT